MINEIIVGDAFIQATRLEPSSIDCIVTSPPYYQQRTYTTYTSEIGREESIEKYLTSLARVFRMCRHALKPTGTMFINLGDKYINRALALIPEQFALKMDFEDWILKNKIIWHKPNPMPESVKNRCTQSHEYIYFFTKRHDYYFNADAIKTPSKNAVDNRSENRKRKPTKEINGMRKSGVYPMANKRDTWTIPVAQYPDAHFATFPEEIPETCIKAGCPENGVVLDPFAGAGTTLMVAKKLGRKYIGFELNEDYAKLARERIANTPNGTEHQNANQSEQIPLIN